MSPVASFLFPVIVFNKKSANYESITRFLLYGAVIFCGQAT